MPKRSARTLPRTPRKPYWLAAGGACAAIALIGLLTVSLLSSAGDGENLCQNFDVDPNTGKMRDRGRVPCDQLSAQKGRLEMIREGFKPH